MKVATKMMRSSLFHYKTAGRAIYQASKHGVLELTKSAALEYAPKAIRINAVFSGTIEIPFVAVTLAKEPEAMEDTLRSQPIGRLGRAEEIAPAVLWLCGSGSTFVIAHALVEAAAECTTVHN